MANVSLSLVAGYPVESPSQERATGLPPMPFAGVFKRIADALIRAERARIDETAARLIAENGGVMTDEVERRINRSFGG